MIKNKKNHQIPHTGKWSVRLTTEMLNHLTELTKFKASKLDAYLNLLEDAAVAKATYESAYGQTSSPEAGQLVISITNRPNVGIGHVIRYANSSINWRLSGCCRSPELTVAPSSP